MISARSHTGTECIYAFRISEYVWVSSENKQSVWCTLGVRLRDAIVLNEALCMSIFHLAFYACICDSNAHGMEFYFPIRKNERVAKRTIAQWSRGACSNTYIFRLVFANPIRWWDDKSLVCFFCPSKKAWEKANLLGIFDACVLTPSYCLLLLGILCNNGLIANATEIK